MRARQNCIEGDCYNGALMNDLEAEIARLRAALFKVQCEQLNRATDTDLSAQRHRRLAMATRDRIIIILARKALAKERTWGR